MSEGKSNAQAGHAYVDALLLSLSQNDPQIRARAEAYAALRPGTKVCLDGGSVAELERLADRLDAAGIPYARIIDRDHVEPPHFDGSPVLTAIGLGPFPKSETPRALRRLSMWRGGARARAESLSQKQIEGAN
jgi:PTH2 family peptidyl-tRNA hydrolase